MSETGLGAHLQSQGLEVLGNTLLLVPDGLQVLFESEHVGFLFVLRPLALFDDSGLSAFS